MQGNNPIKVIIQEADFDISQELNLLKNSNTGAIVSFVGCVRDNNPNQSIVSLTLEHYPGMTQKTIVAIVKQAHSRWDINQTTVIHRVGTLAVNENIVLVACSSAHRSEAFLACEFIMDFLKTDAPFWKKETTSTDSYWVDAKENDNQVKNNW